MMPQDSPRPIFGQPGWRRRMQAQYGWDKEFKAVGLILLLVLLSLAFARAGDDTGLPGEDPKDVAREPEVSTTNCVSDMFLPMPGWSRFVKMPPLPDTLKPMGAPSPAAATKPRPAALAETKPDGAPPPKPAPKAQMPRPDADLIAISPFLQWVKDHPDAAVQARKQAMAEAPPAPATAAAPATPGASGDPYWMPPMIDSAGSDDFQGGSATYSRPQR